MAVGADALMLEQHPSAERKLSHLAWTSLHPDPEVLELDLFESTRALMVGM
jgi:hypothetical protein